MSPLARKSRNLAVIAAVALLPATGARAQWYSSYPGQQPAYPYGAQPYAIEVAPGTYVIQRPAAPRRNPYVSNVPPRQHPAPYRKRQAARAAPAAERPHKPVDHALVEQLRKRSHAKSKEKTQAKSKDVATTTKKNVTTTTKIVREKPIVIEHRRVVDDPPRVVERHIVVDDPPTGRGLFQHRRAADAAPPLPPVASGRAPVERPDKDRGAHGAAESKRVIHADAEVTILGPDRMSIRLFRKGDDANARAR